MYNFSFWVWAALVATVVFAEMLVEIQHLTQLTPESRSYTGWIKSTLNSSRENQRTRICLDCCFLIMSLCGLVGGCQCFGGTCHLRLQGTSTLNIVCSLHGIFLWNWCQGFEFMWWIQCYYFYLEQSIFKICHNKVDSRVYFQDEKQDG
jgi:hypothetical protein